jgi:pyruvate/2-oxoglutarate/acetoin dehydrogenase E1 component
MICGRILVIPQEGTDVSIFCFSRMVSIAMEAAEALAAEGIKYVLIYQQIAIIAFALCG